MVFGEFRVSISFVMYAFVLSAYDFSVFGRIGYMVKNEWPLCNGCGRYIMYSSRKDYVY